ncbi:hypothetical protein BJF85_07020 [Saccharomonospora sp. CUA-673]|uniref:hypothetical protein n=1 Tax=Saccharomonospora sp. CUA-673 TaxID=1904969 RepID=UPI00095BB9AC|nr:hypothetical protein [Saccharomonospora sp. CUA-673]OLT40055.1 hypothetical protein BJF85_07020 [Saccharomonospora sp. CUA-673]
MSKSEKPQRAPAPDIVVWRRGLRWVEGAQMQADRFEAVFLELRAALQDAQVRAYLNDDKANRESWVEHYDQNYEPFDRRRPVKVPTQALSMQATTELDLLVVAIRNVLRAQVRLPKRLKTSMEGEDVLELLRNVVEHWDEDGGPSISKLTEQHPDVLVEGISFTNKEIWIGDTIPLSRIQAWLSRVGYAIVSSLESAGESVLDDMASFVTGDDALSWPPDRLRYRYWTLPAIDEQDWPRTDMPPEVAHLMGERFRRIRERDVAD